MDPIALVDMDDTLCDYSLRLFEDHITINTPGEILPPLGDPKYYDSYLGNRTKLIRSQPGWWLHLTRFQLGFDILNVLRGLSYEIHILTKGPSSVTAAWSEKVEWCKLNVPDCKVMIVSSKELVYGKVLVDDFPEYIKSWLEHRPRGTVIMPVHPWNKNFKHSQVIPYDGNNLDFIKEMLGTIAYKSRCE